MTVCREACCAADDTFGLFATPRWPAICCGVNPDDMFFCNSISLSSHECSLKFDWGVLPGMGEPPPFFF